MTGPNVNPFAKPRRQLVSKPKTIINGRELSPSETNQLEDILNDYIRRFEDRFEEFGSNCSLCRTILFTLNPGAGFIHPEGISKED